MKENGFKFYIGDGKTIGDRGLKLPLFQGVSELDDPSGYIASKGLRDAVNVALVLGQPLLLRENREPEKLNWPAALLLSLSWQSL